MRKIKNSLNSKKSPVKPYQMGQKDLVKNYKNQKSKFSKQQYLEGCQRTNQAEKSYLYLTGVLKEDESEGEKLN